MSGDLLGQIAFEGRFLAVGGERLFVLAIAGAGARPRPTAVLVPPYGKTSHDLFFNAAYLAANGFDVLRFDPRRHVGLSSGEIVDFTLSGVLADLERVLAELEPVPAETGGQVVLVGMSLSAPVVFKAARREGVPGVAGVATLVPVVNGGDTLAKVTGHPVEPYRERRPGLPELQEIFGHAVRAGPFIEDMDGAGLGSLEAIRGHVAASRGPVHLLAAAEDEYVSFDEVQRLHEAAPPGSELVVLEAASHELSRSVSATRKALLELTHLCCTIVRPDAERAGLRTPPITEIIRLSSRESTYLAGLSEEPTDG